MALIDELTELSRRAADPMVYRTLSSSTFLILELKSVIINLVPQGERSEGLNQLLRR